MLRPIPATCGMFVIATSAACTQPPVLTPAEATTGSARPAVILAGEGETPSSRRRCPAIHQSRSGHHRIAAACGWSVGHPAG